MARLDPHSYNDSAQPETRFVEWRAHVDFTSRTIAAEATLHLSEGGGPLDLDTRDLHIDTVVDGTGSALKWELFPAEPILGSRLRIAVPADQVTITIGYRTSPEASALQWLDPEQTSGGRLPFLFSQCQAIHARSVLPLQDTPRIRICFTAEMTVPVALRALMAAAFVSREEKGDVAVERYEMKQSIPPYLFAFAVGDLESRELGPRSRVWAEPSVVEKAAWEFTDVDAMITACEGLYGTYEWERFDILTMPSSFPYGGMENPRLTFLTPTLLAGDRSLVNVLAHELAHSWTGNLVSNASADHFWLNEGFTVYAERRIFEKLAGKELAELHAALGRKSLDEAVREFADRPELTRLHTQLVGVDPDDAYSQVPYEKGYLFLRRLEEAVGREAFDPFMRRYIGTFPFRSITTDDFRVFLREALPQAYERVDVEEWLQGTGLPADSPVAESKRLDTLRALGDQVPPPEVAREWIPTEWQLYLESLPQAWSAEKCAELDGLYHLSASANYEILVGWLVVTLGADYSPAFGRLEDVLGSVGRMKFLKPLYRAMARNAKTRPMADDFFARFQGRYHPIARQVVGALLEKCEVVAH